MNGVVKILKLLCADIRDTEVPVLQEASLLLSFLLRLYYISQCVKFHHLVLTKGASHIIC